MKIKRLSLLSLLSLILLSSCGADGGRSVVGIRIVKGSIEDMYLQYSEVDYSNLAVDLMNANNQIYSTWHYLSAEDRFSFEKIDTSLLGTFTFELTYTHSYQVSLSEGYDTIDLSTSIEYDVVSIDRIEVVEGSINSIYLQNSEVDYSSLAINLITTTDEIYQTLLYVDNDDVILSSEVDTSSLGKYTLNISYTLVINDETSQTFETSFEYEVLVEESST